MAVYQRMVCIPEDEYLQHRVTQPYTQAPMYSHEQSERSLYNLSRQNLPPDQLLKLQGDIITRMLNQGKESSYGTGFSNTIDEPPEIDKVQAAIAHFTDGNKLRALNLYHLIKQQQHPTNLTWSPNGMIQTPPLIGSNIVELINFVTTNRV